MYLSDSKIVELLPQLDIVTDMEGHRFDPNRQVQPCSIDLSLSPVFWRERKKGLVDLRRSQLQELSPRHNWRRLTLEEHETIVVKPRQLLLGRTSERFSMPPGYAGQILGRSSFARLGLMVHCAGGFINPGWRGHMPLQLVNVSRSPIRLFPGVPICQLKMVQVNGPLRRIYGERELQSKYMDDDGGPSYWWRDDRLHSLQERLCRVNLPEDIRKRVLEMMGHQEPGVTSRFHQDLDKMQLAQIDNADAIIEWFAGREETRRRFCQAVKGILIGQFGVFFLGVLTNSIFSPRYIVALFGVGCHPPVRNCCLVCVVL